MDKCDIYGHYIVPILGYENSIVGEECKICGWSDIDPSLRQAIGRIKREESKPISYTTQHSPSISEILVDENDKLNSGYYESENW